MKLNSTARTKHNTELITELTHVKELLADTKTNIQPREVKILELESVIKGYISNKF